MKAIMYHYVLPNSDGLPYFRYLALDDFRRQLDHFETEFGFVTPEAFLESLETGEATPGVVLTFDDGFRCHHDHVLPELLSRGLWGIFYVPTLMYRTRQLLDVHRIHVLLGRYGGAAILAELERMITDDMLTHDHVREFQELTYTRQPDNSASTTLVKRILNYLIARDHREVVLGRLMGNLVADEEAVAADFYLTPRQIKALTEAGMIVGSHTVSHPVMSTLDEPAQRREIVESFEFLEAAVGGLGVRTYCHPYGDFHSFDETTERLLHETGCRFAFNVECRDVVAADLVDRPQALPRFDCNQFLYGRARMGTAVAD